MARTDLPPLAVDVANAVGERVGSEQGGGALRPVHRHQRVLAHQHLAHVLGARHADQRAAQQVGLEHVAVLLPPRRVETRTLRGGGGKGGKKNPGQAGQRMPFAFLGWKRDTVDLRPANGLKRLTVLNASTLFTRTRVAAHMLAVNS